MVKAKKNVKPLTKTSITDMVITQQKKYLVVLILCVVTLLISSSYALLTNFDKTDEIITFKAGNLNMSVNNTLIDLSDRLPEGDGEGLLNATPVSLTLTNTGTMFIDGYDVKFVSDMNQTSTLNEDFIKYAISEDEINYSTPSILTTNNNIIFSGYDLEVDQSKTIYLKVWIDETAGNQILNKEYYGSIKIDLYQKKEKSALTGAEEIISLYGTEDGLVAVDTNGTLYDGTGEIREYRYSGPIANNYVIFNDDGDDTIEENELWRIVGVFKNSESKWNLKLVRSTPVSYYDIPEFYVINGYYRYFIFSNEMSNKLELYKIPPASFMKNEIQKISDNDTSFNWDDNYVNDWSEASLQIYLNTESDDYGTKGYYSVFSDKTKSLIDNDYIYYLGNVVYGTPIEIYSQERNVDSTNIHAGNQATWNGKVGLLYSSDYGYAADSSIWNDENENYTTSWLNETFTENEWTLSPSSSNADLVMIYNGFGLENGFVVYNETTSNFRPVLNLVSDAPIDINHLGTEDDPYVIIE